MKKIVKSEFFVVAAAVLTVSLYLIAGVLAFANRQYNEINTENLKDAVNALKNFTPAEVFTDNAATAEWISHIDNPKAHTPYRITLIGKNGHVIFDTDADSAAMENHLDRYEFQAAVMGGTGTAIRQSATLNGLYLYAAIAIRDSNDQFAGMLRLSRTVSGFYPRLLSSAFPFLAGALLIIIGVCAGLYYYSRRVSHSIEAHLNNSLEEKTRDLKIKTEEAETESSIRQVILDSMFEGLIALDSNLKIILVNPRLCSMFGIDNDVRGMPFLEFSHSAELVQAAQTVIARGRSCELIVKRYAQGAEQHFQVNAAPLQSPGPEAPMQESVLRGKGGAVMVLRDITRLVKLEQVRKDFVANVSHELRTPIQVIHGFAETILDTSRTDTEQLRYFAGIIKKNAQSMENLTSDLLTLVSLEDETADRPPLEEAALAPLIAEASDAVSIGARNKNISIEIACSPELKARLHCSLFVQALVNLLDNAIKYSGSDSRIYINASREADITLVEVKDTGIGIPAEHIERIFERFYRVDRSRSRSAEGTGLGLSIVRHIALLHKGTIEAESHAGEGSVFRLRLP